MLWFFGGTSTTSIREPQCAPPSPLQEQAAASLAAIREVFAEIAAMPVPTTPLGWMELEVELHQRVARCLDALFAVLLQTAHDAPNVLEAVGRLIAGIPFLRMQKSAQAVSITLLGGSTIRLTSPYMLRRPPRGPGRPRGRGKRGPEGTGLYPVLAVMGIHERVTPALASEVARQVTVGTVEQAREALQRRGISLDVKTICRLTQSLAARGLSFRDWLVQQGEAGQAADFFRGKRLVLGTDGGRVRTRVKRPGRRRKSGRHGFAAPWREPKLFVIYEVDENGRKKREGARCYDATLGDADALFRILTAMLRVLGAAEAAEWIVVGDGAPWIWERVPALREALGYVGEVTEVVDIYHAKQRLHKIAGEVKRWSPSDRERWLKKAERLLGDGRLEALKVELDQLCVGRHAKIIRSLSDYFVNNRGRMRYGEFCERRVPLGSGAVESCIRRVINLRLKGNGIFWTPANAEGLLHLRAQLMTGRWDLYVAQILTHEVFWTFEGAQLAFGRAA